MSDLLRGGKSARFANNKKGSVMRRMLFGAVAVLCVIGAAEAGEVVLRDTPCRLFDSRNIGGTGLGPKISSGTIETWNNAGSAQGGESGCGIPAGSTGAIINLIAFAPESSGWARLWAYGLTEPLSTSINVTSGQLNEASGLTVHVGTGGKISLNASIGASHYIVDLAGHIDGSGGAHPFGVELKAPLLRRVLSMVNAPVGGLAAGDRLLVIDATANPFIGHDNEYATWRGLGSCDPSTAGCWLFEEPNDGDLAYVASNGTSGALWAYQAIGSATWKELAFE